MVVRKGPQGCFLIKKLSGMDKLYEYAVEVIEKEDPVNLLHVYIYPDREYGELGFDVTGLREACKTDAAFAEKNKDILRRKLGELLEFACKMDDLCLPAKGLIITPSHIFIDTSTCDMKLLYDPSADLFGNDNELPEQAEDVLSTKLFTTILTAVEITDIVCAIKDKDPGMLGRTAAALKEDNRNKHPNVRTSLFLSAILSFAAAAAYFIDFFPLAVVAGAASVYFFMPTIRSGNRPSASTILSADRSRLYFEEKKTESSCIILSPGSGDPSSVPQQDKKAIYLSEAIVGSDLFLSDICFELPSVCPIHVKIFIRDNTYYVKDISMTGLTYIDNKKLQKDEEREIKDGQVLRLGEQDFKVSVGFS